MVKIRLRRMGAKKQPSYRLVVTDSRKPRDGRFIEIIGHYNPRTEPPTVVVQEDRALYWLSVGAQPSDAVALFFRKLKLGDKLKEVHAGAAVADVAEGKVKISGPEKTSKAAKREVAAAAKKKKAAQEKDRKDAEAAAAKAKKAEEAAAAKAKKVEEAAAAKAKKAEEAAAAKAKKATKAEEAERTKAAPAAKAPAEAPAAKAKEQPAEAPPPAKAPAAKAAEKAPETPPEAVPEPKAAAPEAPSATGTVEELGLPGRVASALQKAGVSTAADLAALVAQGDEALLALPGIGAKAVEEIKAKVG